SFFCKMESVLILMKSQWEETSAKLNYMTRALKELKAENEVLKTMLGFSNESNNCNNNNSTSGYLPEGKALRDILEEIQSEVRAIKAQMIHVRENKQIVKKRNSLVNVPEACVQIQNSGEDVVDKFPVLEITNKTANEEREFLERKFKDVRKRLSDPAEGITLMGTSIERISSGISLTPTSTTSCVITLSNYLNSTLTNPQDYIVPGRGKKLSGPSTVTGHTCEVIAIEGGERWSSFLCSFEVSQDLRIAFTAAVARVDGSIFMGVGFVPENMPTDSDMLSAFFKGPSMPDFVAHGYSVARGPVEAFVIHGRYLVRAHMTHGHRSVMHVDILEVVDEIVTGTTASEVRTVKTGEYTIANMGHKFLGSANPCSLDNVACIVDITNALKVSLEESRRFIRSCKHNNFMPYRVLPFTREVFFASNDEIVEAMFAYKIESTDLALVIAMRAQTGGNLFASAFVTLPSFTNKNAYKSLMEVDPTKSRLYRKNASAKDGEQEIQIRNIRATIRMTEDAKSVLKIRIFAI
ncbi:unnamed protein product, partial [Allacma fusca]